MTFSKRLAAWLGLTLVLVQTAFAQGLDGLGQIGPSQSRIVVYSPADKHQSEAASVFVNGAFQAHLVPGQHSHLCHATGKVDVSARLLRADAQSPAGKPATLALDLDGGQTYYLSASVQEGRPQLVQVPAEQAKQALAKTRLETRTLSRASQGCIDIVIEQAKANAVGDAPAR